METGEEGESPTAGGEGLLPQAARTAATAALRNESALFDTGDASRILHHRCASQYRQNPDATAGLPRISAEAGLNRAGDAPPRRLRNYDTLKPQRLRRANPWFAAKRRSITNLPVSRLTSAEFQKPAARVHAVVDQTLLNQYDGGRSLREFTGNSLAKNADRHCGGKSITVEFSVRS